MLNVADKSIEDAWILDSGCSFHMCPHKEWFVELTHQDHSSVLLGNNDVCKVKGIGCVKLKLHDDSVRIMSGVRFIPQLKRNLISLGMLESRGYNFISEEGCLYVQKGSNVILKGVRRNSLYYLLANTLVGSTDVSTGEDINLWHQRLCHVGKKGMDELLKQKVITGSSLYDFKTCEHCILGKSKKTPYQKSQHVTSAPLEYAHADLWGPARTESLGGGKYFLSIMDDFSRKIWIYILKNKSEAFTRFKDWCREVELEKHTSLRCLMTDNGLEFVSEEFNSYCK